MGQSGDHARRPETSEAALIVALTGHFLDTASCDLRRDTHGHDPAIPDTDPIPLTEAAGVICVDQ